MHNDVVEEILKKYPCCGILKKGYHKKDEWCHYDVPWHFSGTFFWFNNKRLFSKDWKNINVLNRFGVETYLSNYFSDKEAFCLKYNLKREHYNPFSLNVWKDILKCEDY